MSEQENQDFPKAKVLFVKDFLDYHLRIPPYQRPYKWKANRHVRQLIEDIIRESGRIVNGEHVDYRIGSIIFHIKGKNYNIVDGQQRLITLSLILEVLNSKLSGMSKNDNFHELLNQEFDYIDSKNNIKYNYDFIEQYFAAIDRKDIEKVQAFILKYCSFVVIKLKELSEAFQLFDSQNSRGKELSPADLLKAFHLREMYENSFDEKKACVKNWENAIDQGLLNTVINKYLFRIRNWNQKKWEYYFSKEKIDAFKGINALRSIQNGKAYPYILYAYQNSMSSMYRLEEPIVNGKRFFDYVDKYVRVYSRILDFTNNYSVKIKGEDQKIFKYKYSGRIGDKRIRTLFQIMFMCYVDKFGFKASNHEDFAKELYRWAYQKRLEKKMIRYESILNIVKANDNLMPLNYIENWHEPDLIWLRSQLKSVKDTDSSIIKGGDIVKKIIQEFEK
jgi:uncharacterized protein with ParB-like and HNH nuclease domain